VTALQVPVGVVDDGLHELVGDAHRVVGVLVLDRVKLSAVEIHVEAGVAQGAGLALLRDLAPDELLDVGVVDVEDDHLGGTAGLAADLMVPAEASAPRMKLTGPTAVPPPLSSS
jgi:hypothetical protein